MTIIEKLKIIDSEIEQNKAQYNFYRQTAKISALSSGNVSKYEFLTGREVYQKKKKLLKSKDLNTHH